MAFWSDIFSNRAKSETNKPPLTIKERFSALKNLTAFLKLILQTSPKMAFINMLLRIIRAAIPLATLYIGKLIIDEVVLLTKSPGELHLNYLFLLIGLEFALAIISDLLNRGTALLDSLLGDLFANQSSIKLMEHAA